MHLVEVESTYRKAEGSVRLYLVPGYRGSARRLTFMADNGQVYQDVGPLAADNEELNNQYSYPEYIDITIRSLASGSDSILKRGQRLVPINNVNVRSEDSRFKYAEVLTDFGGGQTPSNFQEMSFSDLIKIIKPLINQSVSEEDYAKSQINMTGLQLGRYQYNINQKIFNILGFNNIWHARVEDVIVDSSLEWSTTAGHSKQYALIKARIDFPFEHSVKIEAYVPSTAALNEISIDDQVAIRGYASIIESRKRFGSEELFIKIFSATVDKI